MNKHFLFLIIIILPYPYYNKMLLDQQVSDNLVSSWSVKVIMLKSVKMIFIFHDHI